MNDCTFSPDRKHRYLLKHSWAPLLPERSVLWIGLNPSTADEDDLDPTLRRVRGFTTVMGGNTFVMANLFAFRATDPFVMMAADDAVGTENDRFILNAAAKAERIVACWGNHGAHQNRAAIIAELLSHLDVWCLGQNGDGSPKHPLYLNADTAPCLFKARRRRYAETFVDQGEPGPGI